MREIQGFLYRPEVLSSFDSVFVSSEATRAGFLTSKDFDFVSVQLGAKEWGALSLSSRLGLRGLGLRPLASRLGLQPLDSRLGLRPLYILNLIDMLDDRPRRIGGIPFRR